MGSRKLLSSLVIFVIIFAIATNVFINGPLVIFSKADPGDIIDDWNNDTTLNVTVLQLQPRINF